jgi:hypothetical protein
MNYYKRHWNETTGEELTDSWGTSTFYFETDRDNNVLRQIQVFENGKGLKYWTNFIKDKYGALSNQPLDPNDFSPYKIDKGDFEKAWTKVYAK